MTGAPSVAATETEKGAVVAGTTGAATTGTTGSVTGTAGNRESTRTLEATQVTQAHILAILEDTFTQACTQGCADGAEVVGTAAEAEEDFLAAAASSLEDVAVTSEVAVVQATDQDQDTAPAPVTDLVTDPVTDLATARVTGLAGLLHTTRTMAGTPTITMKAISVTLKRNREKGL